MLNEPHRFRRDGRASRPAPPALGNWPRGLAGCTPRNIKLYPPESKAITTALSQVLGPIKEILMTNERLHLSQAQRVLLANGQRIDVSGFQALADSFLELLARTELPEQDRLRDGDAESFGGLEVDDQLNPRDLLHR